MQDPMEGPPSVTLSQSVRVGVVLKRRLEEVARAQGADSGWLARKLLREGLGVTERALWPKDPGRE